MLIPNIEDWNKHGITKYHAQQWLKNGFDKKAAIEWFENGFSIENAKTFKKQGLTPFTAKKVIIEEIKQLFQPKIL